MESVNAAVAALESFHLRSKTLVKSDPEAKHGLIAIYVDSDHRRTDFQAEITIDVFRGTITFRLREIGGLEYTQNPITGNWIIVPADESSEDPFDLLVLGRLQLENVSVEVDDIEGTPVYRLEGNLAEEIGQAGVPRQGRVSLWVRMEDALVLRMEVEGSVPASEYEGPVPTGEYEGPVPDVLVDVHEATVYTFSEYNEPVIIQAPSPPAPPSEREGQNAEFQSVITAINAMMVDNNLASIPNPVSANTAPCTTGTQDMAAFPDTASTVGTADKQTGPNGDAYTDGVDPLGDKDGYLLYTHDIIGDKAQTATVNYMTVSKSVYCYTAVADGSVTQYETDGTQTTP